MNSKIAPLIVMGLLVGGLGACRQDVETLRLGGGPAGGTFQVYARGMAEVLHHRFPEALVRVERSGGSVANLEDLQQGNLDMGLVYAGDAFFAGKQVLALARLYGAPAQLAVRPDSSVASVGDLQGRRVAVGNPGSGAAKSAERFFRATGLWDKIIPVYLGYAMALDDLKRHNVEAVWELVGIPSASLAASARGQGLRLLNLDETARACGFYDQYPFYTPTTIPAGTYLHQDRPIRTFQDNALWLARSDLDSDLVFRALEAVFSPEGLKRMKRTHAVARQLNREATSGDLMVPLHPGAQRYWGQGSKGGAG